MFIPLTGFKIKKRGGEGWGEIQKFWFIKKSDFWSTKGKKIVHRLSLISLGHTVQAEFPAG